MEQYYLMNRNKRIAKVLYDRELHGFTEVSEVYDAAYASPAMLDHNGKLAKQALNAWWRGRAIPASRSHIQQLLDTLLLDSTVSLAEKNFGLSLSDQYWLNDAGNPLAWESVNFFNNSFSEDLGMLTLEGYGSPVVDLFSPNSTLGGDLNKKWMIRDGKRVLLKSGSGFARQEVYNEKIATCLHRRLLEEGEFVTYDLYRKNNATYCVCENMLSDSEELITVYDIVSHKKRPNHQSEFQFLVSCYESLGLDRTEESLCKMFLCDFILANEDRHWRNFGVIRNVETLEYTRIAPIFDTGTSLWCRKQQLTSAPADREYMAKPFGKNGMKPHKQLELFSERDFQWFDENKLRGFEDEVRDILSENSGISTDRVNAIRFHVKENINYAINFVREKRKEKRRGISR